MSKYDTKAKYWFRFNSFGQPMPIASEGWYLLLAMFGNFGLLVLFAVNCPPLLAIPLVIHLLLGLTCWKKTRPPYKPPSDD